MTTDAYNLSFPPNYETEERIWQSKGYVVVELEIHGPTPVRYSLTVRDPTRLAQDVEAELADRPVFAESNVLVVPTVDRASIEAAVEELAQGGFRGLVAD